MTHADIIKRYAAVARPIMFRCGVQRRACITAARITTLALEALGVRGVAAVPVSMAFQVPDLNYCYIAGFPERREELRSKAAEFIDLNGPGPSWMGHLVVVAANYLIDASVDQAQSPAHGVVIDPMALAIPLPKGQARQVRAGQTSIAAQLLLNGTGHHAQLCYEPLDDLEWLTSDAWAHDPAAALVAAVIVEEMRRQ
jgi:hypothetical protein